MLILEKLIKKLFGNPSNRYLGSLSPRIEAINALEKEMEKLSNEALQHHTLEFRKQITEGREIHDLLVPSFAVMREAAKRVLGMRPFDVQMMGGIVLFEQNIAEMRTGEGKTLVATLPVYLNALLSKGVHVVTVNDYLAKRDSAWMGKLYNFMGLTTGLVTQGLSDEERRCAYNADITYATNNELGFDYLRDNMKYEREQMVQRGHYYAIIDEVDSILIDEARTPLIISGLSDDHSEIYAKVNTFILDLKKEDYEIDEKQRTATFTEKGAEKLEENLQLAGVLKSESLYSIENIGIVHSINNALKAHLLFQKDKDYIVKNDEVMIIDEFTGRMMSGRRYSEGLHQALEAKEHVTIQPENQTLASITFQNYFRMYTKLSGMTGTAMTEVEEFQSIYNLNVFSIPTNIPIKRKDAHDEIYRTIDEKYQAIVTEIKQAQEKKQPILVGTTSIEKSEDLAKIFKKEGIRNFQVLNARYHEQEAMIIAQAGHPGAITIATNMAGRGTDIQLGGNAELRIQTELKDMPEGSDRIKKEHSIRQEVQQLKEEAIAAGGLYVLATERHESRRIDNQLRGRSGRQGDPGFSKFYLSIQDDLMRIFGSQRMDSILQKLGMKKNEAIIHPWINKAIEKAQTKVEARNFDIRKNLLKYDDVMNEQRKIFFEQRLELIDAKDIHEIILEMREDVIEHLINKFIPESSHLIQCNIENFSTEAKEIFNIDCPLQEWFTEDGISEEEIAKRFSDFINTATEKSLQEILPEKIFYIERMILLQTLDHLWREHILNLEHLRSVVGLRSYGQRDPLNEYKSEAFELFQSMLTDLKKSVIQKLMQMFIVSDDEKSLILEDRSLDENNPMPISDHFADKKIPRNAPCPCESGKKYKHCHGMYS